MRKRPHWNWHMVCRPILPAQAVGLTKYAFTKK